MEVDVYQGRKHRVVVGDQYGKWTVVEIHHDGSSPAIFVCQCGCGNITSMKTDMLLKGKSTRCLACHNKSGDARRRHGKSNSPEWRVYRHMRNRCENPNDKDYHNYGGRGIKVCERWKTFDEFYADMGDRPSPKHSIDRIDGDGDYEPGNVRWATPFQQSQNRRCIEIINWRGECHCLAEWARRLGIKRNTLRARIKLYGWDVEKAFTTPAGA